MSESSLCKIRVYLIPGSTYDQVSKENPMCRVTLDKLPTDLYKYDQLVQKIKEEFKLSGEIQTFWVDEKKMCCFSTDSGLTSAIEEQLVFKNEKNEKILPEIYVCIKSTNLISN